MKLFFAGADQSPRYNDIIIKNKGTARLESYYSLGKRPPSPGFKHTLLDSGGFVARTRNIEISVIEYAKYINKFNIQFAFNLDTNDVSETLDNQKYLCENTKATILPVYHISDWQENNNLLEKFIKEGFEYIGLGGSAGVNSSNKIRTEYFNHCFSIARDKIKLHGLGVTSTKMLENYPWYSVDSTSWLSFARYGNSKTSNDNRVKLFKAKTKHYLENTNEELKYWVAQEKHITKLWEKRGIKWDN